MKRIFLNQENATVLLKIPFLKILSNVSAFISSSFTNIIVDFSSAVFYNEKKDTLQKGQLNILPSISFKQHFQQICLWLQGGKVKY